MLNPVGTRLVLRLLHLGAIERENKGLLSCPFYSFKTVLPNGRLGRCGGGGGWREQWVIPILCKMKLLTL